MQAECSIPCDRDVRWKDSKKKSKKELQRSARYSSYYSSPRLPVHTHTNPELRIHISLPESNRTSRTFRTSNLPIHTSLKPPSEPHNHMFSQKKNRSISTHHSSRSWSWKKKLEMSLPKNQPNRYSSYAFSVPTPWGAHLPIHLILYAGLQLARSFHAVMDLPYPFIPPYHSNPSYSHIQQNRCR